MSQSVKTYNPPRTRGLNENAFISNVGVPNDLLNTYFNNQQNLKNIKNINGSDSKLNRKNVNRIGSKQNSTSRLDNRITRNEINFQNNKFNENDNIEIMKNYKGVFSVGNSNDNSISKVNDSINDTQNLNNNNNNSRSNIGSKTNSKENVFDKLLESIDNEEIIDNNIEEVHSIDEIISHNDDMEKENSNFINESDHIIIDDMNKSINGNEEFDIDENKYEINIVNIKDGNRISADDINKSASENDEIIDNEFRNENDLIVENVNDIDIDSKNDVRYKPANETINDSNEKKLITSIKENINRMVTNLRSRMSHNSSIVADNSNSVISIINSYDSMHTTYSQANIYFDEIETYWSNFQKSIEEYKRNWIAAKKKKVKKSLSKLNTDENFVEENLAERALLNNLHKSFNELIANIQEDNIDKLKDDFINKSITSIKCSCENLNPELDELDRELEKNSNENLVNEKNISNNSINDDSLKNSLNDSSVENKGGESSDNYVKVSDNSDNIDPNYINASSLEIKNGENLGDVLNNNDGQIPDRNEFADSNPQIYSQENLNKFVDGNSQICSQGNLINFVDNNSQMYSQGGLTNFLNSNPQIYSNNLDNNVNNNKNGLKDSGGEGISNNSLYKDLKSYDRNSSRNSLNSKPKTNSRGNSRSLLNDSSKINSKVNSNNSLGDNIQINSRGDSRNSLNNNSVDDNDLEAYNYNNVAHNAFCEDSNNSLNGKKYNVGSSRTGVNNEEQEANKGTSSKGSSRRSSNENLGSGNSIKYSTNTLNEVFQAYDDDNYESNNTLNDVFQAYSKNSRNSLNDDLQTRSKRSSRNSLSGNDSKELSSNLSYENQKVFTQNNSKYSLNDNLQINSRGISNNSMYDNQQIFTQGNSYDSFNNNLNVNSKRNSNNSLEVNEQPREIPNQKESFDRLDSFLMGIKSFISDDDSNNEMIDKQENILSNNESNDAINSNSRSLRNSNDNSINEKNMTFNNKLDDSSSGSIERPVPINIEDMKKYVTEKINNDDNISNINKDKNKNNNNNIENNDIITNEYDDVSKEFDNIMSEIMKNDQSQNPSENSYTKINRNPSLSKIFISSMTTSNPCLLNGVSDIYNSQIESLDNLIKKSNSDVLSGLSQENIQKSGSLNLLTNIPDINDDIKNISETSIDLVNSESQTSFNENKKKNTIKSKIPIRTKQFQLQLMNTRRKLKSEKNGKPRFSSIIINNENIPSKLPIYRKLSPKYVLTPSYIYNNKNDNNDINIKNNSNNSDDIIDYNKDSNNTKINANSKRNSINSKRNSINSKRNSINSKRNSINSKRNSINCNNSKDNSRPISYRYSIQSDSPISHRLSVLSESPINHRYSVYSDRPASHRYSIMSNRSQSPRHKSKVLNNTIEKSKIPRGACSLSTQDVPLPQNKKHIKFSKYYFKNKIHLISNENGMYYIKDEEYNLSGR